MGMRVGDLVQLIIARISNWPAPEEKVLAPEIGTIIGIDGGETEDERTVNVKVRWNTGKVTDHGDDYEVADSYHHLEVVTPELYVNVYLWDRQYGGCEEGGWWYDTYDPESDKCVLCATPEEAEKLLEEMEAWCTEENKTRRHPSSVLSEGHYRARLEAWPAESEPKYTPHYC